MRMRSTTLASSPQLSRLSLRQSPRSWNWGPHGCTWPTSSNQLERRATAKEETPVNSSASPEHSGQSYPAASIISGNLASKTFSIFSASSAALGLGAISAPGLLIALVLPGAEAGAMDETLLRLAGGTMAISCAAEFCLKASAPVSESSYIFDI